jgi:hypothetical protein
LLEDEFDWMSHLIDLMGLYAFFMEVGDSWNKIGDLLDEANEALALIHLEDWVPQSTNSLGPTASAEVILSEYVYNVLRESHP